MDSRLPQSRKKRWRIRFTLRTLFVLLTAATIFVGWRYNQRDQLQIPARKIQERGGTVFYRWQNSVICTVRPRVPRPDRLQEYAVMLPDGSIAKRYRQVQLREYKVRLPDGSIVTKTQATPLTHLDYLRSYERNHLVATRSDSPGFQLFDFLCGDHNDLEIGAVSLPYTAVDREMISLLSELPELETLVLEAGPKFQKAAVARYVARRSGDQPSEDIAEYLAELRHATELVQKHLPEVSLPEGGVPPMAKWRTPRRFSTMHTSVP